MTQSFQEKLWQTLSTNSLFHQTEDDGNSAWSYTAPITPPSPPLLTSLRDLKMSLSERPAPQKGRFQHTLDALTDLTGYISTQTYASFRASAYGPGQGAYTLPAEEEEVRREIRALKGLVLNRCAYVHSY